MLTMMHSGTLMCWRLKVSDLNPGTTGHMVDKLGICLQQKSRGDTALILHTAAWYQLRTTLSGANLQPEYTLLVHFALAQASGYRYYFRVELTLKHIL